MLTRKSTPDPPAQQTRIQQIMLAIGMIHEEHEAKRKEECDNDLNGHGQIACPACDGGKIRYYIFGSKLKTRGACSTKNCLAWME